MLEALTYLAHWFAWYPIVGLLALAITAIVAFGAVGALGVPDMFWRQPPMRAFVVGCSLAVLFSLITFNGFLLESGDHPSVNSTSYFWSTYPVLFALLLIGAWRFRREGDTPDHGRVLALLAGHVLTIAAILAIGNVVMPRLQQLASQPFALRMFRDVAREDVAYHLTAAFVFAVMFAIYIVLEQHQTKHDRQRRA